MSVTMAELLEEARAQTREASSGRPLSGLEASLIKLGVAVSVTSLNPSGIDEAIGQAFREGATPQQVQEVISLISGLGVHSLMATSVKVVDQARVAGFDIDADLDAEQQELWDRHVGDDPFWTGFGEQLPGFLRAMLLLSKDQFTAFFDYCAVPWKSGTIRAQLKELIAMASDATPTHRFLPGFRLHLANALKLGATREQIEGALAVAASAPEHIGTR